VIGFLWPLLLPLLLLVPIAVIAYLWNLRRRRPVAVRYSSLSLIRAAIPGSSRGRRHLPFALLLAASAFLVVSAARPVIVEGVPTQRSTLILTIDVSGSMCSSDIWPSRLSAAEDAAAEFIGTQSDQVQIGIVAFSGTAQLVQPPTNDHERLLQTLATLTVGQGTQIGSALLSAIGAVPAGDGGDASNSSAPSGAQASVPSAPQPSSVLPTGPQPTFDAGTTASSSHPRSPDAIVLLTDGSSHGGPGPIAIAKQAAARGLPIYAIGFGTQKPGEPATTCMEPILGTPGPNGLLGNGNLGTGYRLALRLSDSIDETTLRAVADVTGGRYYPAQSATQLQQAFADLPTSEKIERQPQDVSVWFLVVGGLLAAAAVITGHWFRSFP
jgi:Ca-activated chloride channel family protein